MAELLLDEEGILKSTNDHISNMVKTNKKAK
jgi:hypothetical protein